MRLAPLALLVVVACSKSEPPPEKPATAESPATAAPTPPPAPQPVDAVSPPPAKADWKPPLAPAELKAMNDYVGFSGDGLAFAYTQYSSGAGMHILTFQASTTNTIEKTVPLENDAVRQQVAAELAEDAYPMPGALPKVPPVVAATANDGLVTVTFSGLAAAKPFPALAEVPNASIGSVEVVAVSRDGQRAAVRTVSAKPVTEFGPARVYHVVKLFE